MGNYKDNPKTPYEVRVPNKIRTRMALIKLYRQPAGPEAKKRGSLWSRFSKGVANFFNIKPEVRK